MGKYHNPKIIEDVIAPNASEYLDVEEDEQEERNKAGENKAEPVDIESEVIV